jgi:hypothetical protein
MLAIPFVADFRAHAIEHRGPHSIEILIDGKHEHTLAFLVTERPDNEEAT